MKPSTYKLICGFSNRRVNVLRLGFKINYKVAAAHLRRLRKSNTRQQLSEHIQSIELECNV